MEFGEGDQLRIRDGAALPFAAAGALKEIDRRSRASLAFLEPPVDRAERDMMLLRLGSDRTVGVELRRAIQQRGNNLPLAILLPQSPRRQPRGSAWRGFRLGMAGGLGRQTSLDPFSVRARWVHAMMRFVLWPLAFGWDIALAISPRYQCTFSGEKGRPGSLRQRRTIHREHRKRRPWPPAIDFAGGPGRPWRLALGGHLSNLESDQRSRVA